MNHDSLTAAGLTDLAHKVSNDRLHCVDTLLPYLTMNCCTQFFPNLVKLGLCTWIILSACFPKFLRSSGKPWCNISMVKSISVVASSSVRCDPRAFDSALLWPISCCHCLRRL